MHSDEKHGAKSGESKIIDCQHCKGAGETQKDCCQHTAKAMPWETAPCCVCKGKKKIQI